MTNSLDRLVSQYVMGWGPDAAEEFGPSQSIVHAMQVKKKLGKDYQFSATELQSTWMVTFYHIPTGKQIAAYGTTLEETICVAALKTKEINL